MTESDPKSWGSPDCPRLQGIPWSVAGDICAHVLCMPPLLPAHPCGQFSACLPQLPCWPHLTMPCFIADEQLPDGAGAQGGLAHHVPGSHRLR